MQPFFYTYQQRWINDTRRFKVGMFARQAGKTFTTTFEPAEDMVFSEMANRSTDWVILSRGERQARQAMEKGVKMHLRAMNAAFDELETDFKLSDRTTVKQLEIVMRNGSRIMALPSSPDTARGFTANVILDEFAFHPNSRKIWQALFPVISSPGLKLRVISTPNGKGNKFYDLMTGHSNIWSRHTVDIYQAVADGLPRDIQELREALGDEEAWEQEFELQWLDEATAWLSWELINSVEDDKAGIPVHYAGGPCFVGVDIARRRNLWVATVLEEVGDVLWARERVELRNAKFAVHDAALDDIFARYRVLRCCKDQTGMGEKPVEDAKRRYGESRVEGVLFTSPNKLTLATLGKQAFEDRKLRTPMGDQPLRSDLHKLKKISGPTGAPRFVAEDDDEDHADRTWSLFLAVNAAHTPRLEYGYTPAYQPRDSFMHPDDDDDYNPRGAW